MVAITVLLLQRANVDAESFRGKLYLLLIDKLVVGAIVALAFVVYERYKESDAQRFQKDIAQLTHRLEQERAATQQTLERARLLGELIPLLRDPKADPLARAYLLRSAVTTGLIDADGAVELASSLFINELTQDQFARVMSVTVPEGIPAIAQQGVALSQVWRKEHGDEFSPGATFNPVSGKESIPEEMRKTVQEGRAWRRVLTDALPALDHARYGQLEDTATIPTHLYGLFVLMNPGDSFEARNLSQRSCRTMRLIGNIGGVFFQDSEAAAQLSHELTLDHTNLDNIRLARVVISILSEYGRPLHVGGQIAKPLARILVEENLGRHLPPEVQSAHYWLRFEAGELLTNIEETRSAEHVLIEFVSRFRSEVAKINTSDHSAMDSLSSRWEGGKILRLAVLALANIHTEESKQALRACGALPVDVWPAFPFLREDIERASKKQNGSN